MKELFKLNPLIFRYKWHLLLGTIFIIISNFIAVYTIRFVGEAINIIESFVSNSAGNGEEASMRQLMFYSALIIGLPILTGILTFLKRQTIIVASRHIEFDLKNNIYKHYQELDTSFYKKNRTGDLMNRISEDVGYVRMYLGPGIMYPIDLLSLSIILITEMFLIDSTLTLYTLAPLPVLSVLIYFVSKAINKQSLVVQEEQSRLSSLVHDYFSGIRIIKSFNKEKVVMEEYEGSSESYRSKSIDLANIQAVFAPLMLIVIGVSQILILYAGGVRYINGAITEIGIVAQFFMYLNMLIWPFTSLGWVSMVIQRAEASMGRINEFLSTKSSLLNLNHESKEISGHLRFENVYFVYDNTGIQALTDVSFTLQAGQTLAVIGKTGSGKSTIADLIVRLYDPTSGTIYVDEIAIPQHNIEYLRTQIGYVPQEAFLFGDSLANNIAFGVDETTQSEIEKYAKLADVHENIVDFHQGYETVVGERGVTLSGGQKQRVSIARAMIKEPKILIFDDSLSAVDTNTEETILQNIMQEGKEKTVVIITHRVSAAKNANQIIVLDNGRIVQTGTHESLISQSGLYQEMYAAQIKKENKEVL
ncbi:MAG: ABC transporter ATP-binding protein [Weeksellaceae bacterium]|nr:ABC transporter ATP-binding protein [Weeksellaceae bacterium]